jgi:hypothetical protein
MNSIDAELATLHARIAELEQQKRNAPAAKENERWTNEDDRTLITMLRFKAASFLEVAAALKRSESAILWRVEKLVTDHVHHEGPHVDEVCQWLMPHIPIELWMKERAKLL